MSKGKGKTKKQPIVPYKGDQLLLFEKEDSAPDYAALNASDRTGSHCDNPESKQNKRYDPTWGDLGVVLERRQGLPGETPWSQPISPMKYPPMKFNGIRGGLVLVDLSGVYIGPGYTLQKGKKIIRVKRSPLAGSFDFPSKGGSGTLTYRMVEDINLYVATWEKWFLAEGRYLEQCRMALDDIGGELKAWGGVTLLHHCKRIDPIDDKERRLKCPSTLIGKILYDEF